MLVPLHRCRDLGDSTIFFSWPLLFRAFVSLLVLDGRLPSRRFLNPNFLASFLLRPGLASESFTVATLLFPILFPTEVAVIERSRPRFERW